MTKKRKAFPVFLDVFSEKYRNLREFLYDRKVEIIYLNNLYESYKKDTILLSPYLQNIKAHTPHQRNGGIAGLPGNGFSEKNMLTINLDDWEHSHSVGLAQPLYWPKYRRAMFRHKWRILAAVVITNLLWMLIQGLLLEPRYTTSAILEFNRGIVAEKKNILNTTFFLERLSATLDDSLEKKAVSVQQLKENLAAQSSELRTLLIISYRDKDPQRCAQVTNLAGQLFIEHLNELFLKNPNTRLATLRLRLKTATAERNALAKALADFQARNPGINAMQNQPKSPEMATLQQSLNRLKQNLSYLGNALEELKSGKSIEKAHATYRELLTFLVNNPISNASELSQEYNRLYNEREQLKRQKYYAQTLPFQRVTEALEGLQQDIHLTARRQLQSLQREKTAIERQLATTQSRLSSIQKTQQRLAELQENLQTAEQNKQRLQIAYQQAKAAGGENYANARILQPAMTPLVRNAFLPDADSLARGTFLGIVLSFLIIGLLTFSDQTIKDPGEIEFTLQLPVLACIPYLENNNINPNIRDLRLLLTPTPSNTKTELLITSLNDHEGKTYLSKNLAVSFAQANQPTLLIDGNLGNGNLHKCFNIKNDVGLSTLLLSDQQINSQNISNYIRKTPYKGLYIITAGTQCTSPAECLDSPRLKQLYQFLRQHFSAIIIDAPALQSSSNVFYFKQLINHTLLIVRYKTTKMTELQQGLKRLVLNEMKVRGVIINAVNSDSITHNNRLV